MHPTSRAASLAALFVLAACGDPEGTDWSRRSSGEADVPSAPGSSPSSPAPSTPSGGTEAKPQAPAILTGAGFEAIAPVRLVDSRDGSGLAPAAFAGTLEPGVERTIELAGLDAQLGPIGKRAGLALNVTVTETEAAGFMRVYPCGTQPDVSMANFRPAESIGAFVIVEGGERFCVMSSARTKLVVDALGVFDKGGGARFSPMSPRRVFDSRSGAPATTFTIPVSGLPAGAQGVAAHLTITQPAGAGFARAYPCGSEPSTSTINFGPNETMGTTALVKLDGASRLCVTSSVPTHVVVDIEGSFGGGKLGFALRTPQRILDSRGGDPRTEFVFMVPSLPLGATAAALHVTAVDAPGSAYVTAHPCLVAPGETSILNVEGAAPRTSLAFAPIDGAGQVCLTASSPLHLIADVTGVIAP